MLVKINGKNYDYDGVVEYMDDAIREDLHDKLAPCSEQGFVNVYLAADPDFMERYEYDLFPVD